MINEWTIGMASSWPLSQAICWQMKELCVLLLPLIVHDVFGNAMNNEWECFMGCINVLCLCLFRLVPYCAYVESTFFCSHTAVTFYGISFLADLVKFNVNCVGRLFPSLVCYRQCCLMNHATFWRKPSNLNKWKILCFYMAHKVFKYIFTKLPIYLMIELDT